ncbi:hypothetical protein CQ017_08735 [Arthrobacter sp. MYb224]|nr:hypothetical protein CQ017_08735 [Arthrobacter sp. MYb224]
MMSTTTLYPRSLNPEAHQASLLADALLEQLGRASVRSISPAAFAGRNGTWVLTLADGSKVFAKRFSEKSSTPRAFNRSLEFARFAHTHPHHAPASARLIASNEIERLLIFDYCPGESLASMVVEERVPADFASRAGEILGRLHTAAPTGLEPTTISSPPIEMLHLGVPQAQYQNFTLAEIALWAQLQSDNLLINAAVELRDWELQHQTSPIHADLRLDQFHLEENELLLLDWEEFGLGDPARDLGMLAGEWIYRAVLDTVTSRGNAGAPPEHFDEELATAVMAQRMGMVVPQIQELWRSYTRIATGYDEQLPVRATAHLGWHLIDRSIARAAMVSRLPGIERAAAGVGRKALLSPGSYYQALGFGRSEH